MLESVPPSRYVEPMANLTTKVRQRERGSVWYTVEIHNPFEERVAQLQAIWAASTEAWIDSVTGSKIDSVTALPTDLETDDWLEVVIQLLEPWSSIMVRYQWRDEPRPREQEVQIQSDDAYHSRVTRWEEPEKALKEPDLPW